MKSLLKSGMLAAAACLAAGAPAISQTDVAWLSLFNGRNLDNWGYVAANWKVDSGMIVGKAKSSYNNFCHTNRKYGDFVFAARVRLWETSTAYINSGIQYRSAWIDSSRHSLKGYQMDIGDGYNGSMYPEGGYPSDAKSVSPSAACKAAVKLNDWNQYVITANGSSLKHEMNGKVCAEYTGSVKEGYIGLQLHFTEVVMEVDFKDLFIRPLNNSFVIPDSQMVYLNADYAARTGTSTVPDRHTIRPFRTHRQGSRPTIRDGRLMVPAFREGGERSFQVTLLDATGRIGFSRSIIAGDDLPLVVGLPNFGAGNHILRVGPGTDATSGFVRSGR